MSAAPDSPASSDTDLLRVLTLNIQVGLRSSHYRHYLTQAWRHFLPSRGVRGVLDEIGNLAAGYDLVALQECDAGSLRTMQLNQVAYLAGRAALPHWQAAVNRDLGPFAQHCLGAMSRDPMRLLQHHALPGLLPGRGALDVEVARPGYRPLRMVVVHLALGRRARSHQLGYLGALLEAGGDALVLGDFNCEPQELDAHPSLRRAGLKPVHRDATYPAWAPTRSIDHVLATEGLDVREACALDARLSDHLPVALSIRLRREDGRR